MKRSIRQRLDAFINTFTGLGDVLRDKRLQAYFQRQSRLSDQRLEDLYHGNDMAARICSTLPDEALRKGFRLSSDEDDIEVADALFKYRRRTKFDKALLECAIWSRVFGGAVIYVGADDGSPEDQPLELERVRSVTFLTVLDKRDIYPSTWYRDLERYGQPEVYEIQAPPVAGQQIKDLPAGTKIHESRLIRLDGTLTSLRRQQENNGWSESVLDKVHEVLRDFDVSWDSVGHLMTDAAQGVFKIKGLVEMLAEGGSEALNARMELVDMCRSVARAILVDAEAEDYDRKSYSFQGIPDILKLFMVRLAGAAGMPVSVLMGSRVLASSLNSQESEDTRRWYDVVQAYQMRALEPAIRRFFEIVFAAQDFEFEPPESWSVRFERLWQMTDKEQAEIEKSVAERDKIYIDAEVLLSEEVALSRFTSQGFSSETQIDREAREEMREAEIELAKEKAGEEPEPPPQVPTPGRQPVQEPEG
jgi:phage-related protein (TIGR01555 family)